MTLALAKELAPHVPVAMIQPAMIDPPPDFTEADIQAVIAQTPAPSRGHSRTTSTASFSTCSRGPTSSRASATASMAAGF